MLTHILQSLGDDGVDGRFVEQGAVVMEFDDDVLGVREAGMEHEVGERVRGEVVGAGARGGGGEKGGGGGFPTAKPPLPL